jgi:hypothetical protein
MSNANHHQSLSTRWRQNYPTLPTYRTYDRGTERGEIHRCYLAYWRFKRKLNSNGNWLDGVECYQDRIVGLIVIVFVDYIVEIDRSD